MINIKPNKDTYQIIFSSHSGVPVVAGSYTSINYYCNWASMLPIDKCTKYECSFVLKSVIETRSEIRVGCMPGKGFEPVT